MQYLMPFIATATCQDIQSRCERVKNEDGSCPAVQCYTCKYPIAFIECLGEMNAFHIFLNLPRRPSLMNLHIALFTIMHSCTPTRGILTVTSPISHRKVSITSFKPLIKIKTRKI